LCFDAGWQGRDVKLLTWTKHSLAKTNPADPPRCAAGQSGHNGSVHKGGAPPPTRLEASAKPAAARSIPWREAQVTQMEVWLAEGDLSSDGVSDEVVAFVLRNLETLPDLVGALELAAPVVRGHAADALEKVARSRPIEVGRYFETYVDAAQQDEVPMVRWHLAMLLGHLSVLDDKREDIGSTLLTMLTDDSVFVVSWAIASLSILACLDADWHPRIVGAIAPLQGHASTALRTRASKAMAALTDADKGLPKTWVKSRLVRKALRAH
jgi:hypothetical protein